MGVLVDGKLDMKPAMSQPRKPTVSWAVSKEVWVAGRGRWSCPTTLCWRGLTWSTMSRCGVISIRDTWICWSASRGGAQKWSKEWNTPLQGQSRRAGAVQPGEGAGETWEQPFSIWRGGGPCKKDCILKTFAAATELFFLIDFFFLF